MQIVKRKRRLTLSAVRQSTNPMMCGFNAQTMIARTDLVHDGSEYMKVVCTRAKNADQWMAEIGARKAAIQ